MDMMKELAKFALQMVQSATVRADDQTQQNVAAVKNWLAAIVGGELLVINQPKPAVAAAVKKALIVKKAK